MEAECLRNCLSSLPKEVVSVVIYGSVVRGDFAPGVSDLDFFVVLRRGCGCLDPVSHVKDALKTCCDRCGLPGEVDLAWLYEDEVLDPVNRGYPFKFLTVYQDDFKANHVVLYGPDPADLLPEYPKPWIYCWRAGRLLQLSRERVGMALRIVAGEAVRLLALAAGASSISKTGVLSALRSVEDGAVRARAMEVWRGYLGGRRLWGSDEYARETVRMLVAYVSGRLGCPPQS